MLSLNIDKEVKNEFQLLSNDLKNLSVKLLSVLYIVTISTKKFVLDYIDSLNDFRRSNIQEWGFVNILIQRAYKFFGLEEEEKRQRIKRKVKRGAKRIFKKFCKLLLFPLVLVYYVFSALFQKKHDKNVKNNYKV